MYMSPHLHHAFEDGTTISNENWHWKLQQFSPGSLVLTSGKILACDPLAFWEHEPFVRVVPAGTYPIYLTVAHDLKNSDQRVAFARLQFMIDKVPVRWELATLPDQDTSTLEPDHFFGYGVDAGTGSFMDIDAIPQWGKLIEKSYDTLSAELDKNYKDTWTWSNFGLDQASGLNVVMFSSGGGDGRYPSYWGFNAADQVVCLVTDFLLFK